MSFIEQYHTITQKVSLNNEDIAVAKAAVFAKVARDAFISGCDILRLSDAVATGVGKIGLHRGSDKRLIIANFFKAPTLTTAVVGATPTSVLIMDDSIKDTKDNTDTKLHRLGDVVKWIYANKLSGTTMTAYDTDEAFYFLSITVVSGTVAPATKLFMQTILGQ